MHDSYLERAMNSSLSSLSFASLIGAVVATAGLAGCDRHVGAAAPALSSAVALSHPAHPCRAPDALSTQKGCRPSTVTVGTK